MNLMQIDYFVEVSKQLNFTTAAKNLYISQPALSKQIALLEEELGVKILERNQRSVSLTQAGMVLLEECEKIQLHIINMIGKVQQMGKHLSTNINIGCLKSIISEDIFKDKIQKFLYNYPECNLNLAKYELNELREKLEDGSLDIIFTLSFELNEMNRVLYKTLKYRSGQFIISKEHPISKLDILTFEDIKEIPFIVIDDEHSKSAYNLIQNKWKQFNFVPSKVIKVPNIDTLISYVELGIGITILDEDTLEKNKNIKCYDVPNGKNTVGVVAVWKKKIEIQIYHYYYLLLKMYINNTFSYNLKL